ncbi:protein zyg-11 homolog isoform X2 [Lampris incognitus]|uniref:protein zyg-11 homolog isoform X2 n=1 Tax=Lampris incognitus TaxID=2546036 RepID=UPI0024B4C974|nr:protein zyg-11 homolog isoform X2 [Lampris incognitus]
MDAEGPRALSGLCLAQVCRCLDLLCVRRADGSLSLSWAPVLPQEVADQLLREMAADGRLSDRTIGIFRDYKKLRLRQAFIRCCPVSAEAFRLALSPHRLQELDASWIPGNLTGADILSGLASNPECRHSLQRLSLNGLHLDWESLGEDGGTRVKGFSSLQGLKGLAVANTDLSDAVLEDICSLPRLESLDISSSAVTDLTALLECRVTLRSLIAHRLWQLDMSPTRLLFVLSQLHSLRHLDFSDDRFVGSSTDDNATGKEDEAVRQLLEGSPQVLPSLISLDVSGRKRISEAAIRAFVEARSGLVFLGLLATGVSSCDIFSSQRNLKVAGEANENQVCEALRRYNERENFTQEALIHLYNITANMDKPRPNILKLVVSGMQSHLSSLHVQLVATACVFNLTTQDLAESMPVHLLSSAVNQLLHAMNSFPNHQQVQKNCLLALCSDYILQDVPFDKYLAAKLVMSLLSSHEDPTLQRMAVAVISILVAKLSTEETAQLGTDKSIMKQLLGIVQQKAMMGVVDTTLKFALSALWNLTDETPTAARHFIQCQGLELYEEVLENNIAEVVDLQGDLMEEDLLEHILNLLQDSQVEVGVRYFAGGVLAQLTSRPEAWTLEEELHTAILEQLHACIMTWIPPEREMVSYRSFRPFIPLLQTSQPSGVQLWAAWAIHLVCSQNTTHYCSMLRSEGVVNLLRGLAAHTDTHSDIRRLVELILCMADQHPSHTRPLNNQPGPQSS